MFKQCVILVGILVGTTLGMAQTQAEIPAAPVPMQIVHASKIFLANAASESTYWMDRLNFYTGGPNRSYNQFYAAMKSWGQKDLVSSPADADLVLEIEFDDHPTPEFRLLVLDPKTGIKLWALNQYVDTAARAKNREKNYNLAMTNLVEQVKHLLSPPASAAK